MARYTGPVCRICRREGLKLYLKGTRCYSDKCAVERRGYSPGQHGRRRRKLSDYGIQLREKQKMRRTYGLLEKQFRKYYVMADRTKGVTGENLIKFLERRLDNVIYRMKFAESRNQARQLVLHGHYLVNGKRVSIPSYLVSEGDTIEIREQSQEIEPIMKALESGSRQVPEWIEWEPNNFRARFVRAPERDELGEEIPFREQLVVELYSK